MFGTRPTTVEEAGIAPMADDDGTERVLREGGIYSLPRTLDISEWAGVVQRLPAPRACMSLAAGLGGDAAGGAGVAAHAHQPLPYVGSAFLSMLGLNQRSTFFLARLAVALQTALLSGLAFWSVVRASQRDALPVIAGGLALGLTPLTLSLTGVIAPSGIESWER